MKFNANRIWAARLLFTGHFVWGYCQLKPKCSFDFRVLYIFVHFLFEGLPERKMYSQIIAGKNVMSLGQPAQFFTTIVVLFIYSLQKNPAVTYAATQHQGRLFWITYKWLKLLRKASCLQVIQNSAPSVVWQRQCDIWISCKFLTKKCLREITLFVLFWRGISCTRYHRTFQENQEKNQWF